MCEVANFLSITAILEIMLMDVFQATLYFWFAFD